MIVEVSLSAPIPIISKQSLIAEVVTGKIDVRNITIPQYEKVETILETDDIDGLEVQDYGD